MTPRARFFSALKHSVTVFLLLLLAGDLSRSSAQEASAELRVGTSGKVVEALQRTLNARLAPSPGLTTDGEFGPSTRMAVVRFQEMHDLKPTGVVGPETWQALGPLLTGRTPVPEPEAVNGEELEAEPADDPDGPPFVTCRAWAIGDGRTGELLWGGHADQKRPMASTTKIMTAWLVMQLADADPAVLDEEVVFSKRAAATGGSTAGLWEGERLSVRELLYGLMLPSGNDASVALGEHFGGRFDPPEDQPDADDPLVRFIAEMNRAAERLGLQETAYANTHGLSHPKHHSSARDLLKLGWTAMQSPLFRQLVQTRQRGCRVTGTGGYQRNIHWKNTNELLGIVGYQGVKTGTTTAAGACLVSCGRNGEDDLFMVILGSTSSDARYIDTRNLYRWAWQMKKQ